MYIFCEIMQREIFSEGIQKSPRSNLTALGAMLLFLREKVESSRASLHALGSCAANKAQSAMVSGRLHRV